MRGIIIILEQVRKLKPSIGDLITTNIRYGLCHFHKEEPSQETIVEMQGEGFKSIPNNKEST